MASKRIRLATDADPTHGTDFVTPLSRRNNEWFGDRRIDPRIRSFFAKYPFRVGACNEVIIPLLDGDALGGGEALAPSAGLDIAVREIPCQPDGNTIKASVMSSRDGSGTPRACVIYLHGGGMSRFSSFYKCFQTLGRLVAHHGVVVVMPDFRNTHTPAQPGNLTSKFPGGLSDCCSAARWVRANHASLGVDPERIALAGESGGGTLAVSTALSLSRAGERILSGLYVLCPLMCGIFPNPAFPSTYENAGIFLDYPDHEGPRRVTKIAATPEEGERLHEARDALAWPGYATLEDLRGLVARCTVVVNEFDPMRDEGIEFYRKCMAAGISARCVTLNGTIHAVGSMLINLCPEISVEQGRAMADFAKQRREPSVALPQQSD